MEPVEGDARPVQEHIEPVEGDARPVQDRMEPVEGDARPVQDRMEPVEGDARPVEEHIEPAPDDARPVQERIEPPGEYMDFPMKQILVKLDDRCARDLETEKVEGLTIPTVTEMARIKAWLLAIRHTVRDYLDTVVLFERLGPEGVEAALGPFDAIYRQSNGASPLAEVAERLAAGSPADLGRVDLKSYRGLSPPWNDWDHVRARGRAFAPLVARIALEERP
jgi:hypothetical protein